MDELEIAGQRYLSTRRAGKEHKYHSDYIGQLIRGGKVVGQKVGRSWYVQEASLNEYLSGSVETSKAPASKSTPILKVEPVAPREEMKEVFAAAPQPVAAAEVVAEEKVVEPVVEADVAPVKISVAAPAVNTTPVRRVPLDDTNKISINAQKSPVKTNTLRYIADDAPALPVAPVKKVAVTVSEEVPTYEAEYLPPVEEVQRNSKFGALSFAVLAIVGFVTLSITAGASVIISSQTIVEEGQVAGAGFTLK